MTGFLTGAAAAAVLAAATWVALNAFTVTQIERLESPNVELEGVEPTFTPDTR